jgi:hypothetical protein
MCENRHFENQLKLFSQNFENKLKMFSKIFETLSSSLEDEFQPKKKLEWFLQALLKIENCPTLFKTNCNQKMGFKTNKHVNIKSWKHSYYATNDNTKKLTIVT